MPHLPELPEPSANPAEDEKQIVDFLRSVEDTSALVWLSNPRVALCAQREVLRRVQHGGSPEIRPVVERSAKIPDEVEERLRRLEKGLSKVESNIETIAARQAQRNQNRTGPPKSPVTSPSAQPKAPTPRASSARVKEVIQLTSTPVLHPAAPASASSLEKLKREAQQRNKVWVVAEVVVVAFFV